MLRLLGLWLLSVLVDDAGHHGLAQFTQVVVLIGAVVLLLLWLVALAAANE